MAQVFHPILLCVQFDSFNQQHHTKQVGTSIALMLHTSLLLCILVQSFTLPVH